VGLLTIAEALARVLERAAPLEHEQVALADAVGRVLARPALARTDLPPFPSSAMDGFAVRAADTPGTLAISARIAAGRPVAHPLGPGEAMGIATGGAVPDGADAVVPVEEVVERANAVDVSGRLEPGANVRQRGGDVRRGEQVVPAGAVLGPSRLAALAAAGVDEVACGRRPQAVVLTTGTELRPPGSTLGPGEIYESNGVMLETLLASAGAQVRRLGPVPDDEQAHRAALQEGLAADVLVTSGGVSVGPHDLVRALERELGVEELFWGVAMRPGKPVSFGIRARTLVFGLPGNPVSSLVGGELFVRPALLALQGAAEPGPRWQLGVLAAAVARNTRRDELVRVRSASDGEAVVLSPLDGQESHQIVRSAAADALALVERGEGALPAGATVRYLRLA
jgi:molybdopterin molybdotransferase